MAQFTYTKIEETVAKADYNTWLTNLTSAADTRIIFYEELPTVDKLEEIRVKVILEVQS